MINKLKNSVVILVFIIGLCMGILGASIFTQISRSQTNRVINVAEQCLDVAEECDYNLRLCNEDLDTAVDLSKRLDKELKIYKKQ